MSKEHFGTFYHAIVRVPPPWWKLWQWEDSFYYVSVLGGLTKDRADATVFVDHYEAFAAAKMEAEAQEFGQFKLAVEVSY